MITRCAWAGSDPLMQEYHDREWGIPLHDERRPLRVPDPRGRAGRALSWATILRKREHYRRAFSGFDPAQVARLSAGQGARAPRRSRHRPQPAQGRGAVEECAGVPRAAATSPAGPTPSSGASSAAVPACNAVERTPRGAREHARVRRDEPASSSGAASPSSARRSATPSCRRRAWSTTTPKPASAQAAIRAHLLRWRPRPHAQRRETTPRVPPSGAASQLDLSRPPAGACRRPTRAASDCCYLGWGVRRR